MQGMIAPQTHFDLAVAGEHVAGPLPPERLRRLLRHGQRARPSRRATRSSAATSRWPPTTRATSPPAGSAAAGCSRSTTRSSATSTATSRSRRCTSWRGRSSRTTTASVPTESYYNGCSDGGREAMEMAERYPDDFNGIIAGAPEIIAGPLNAENQTWDVPRQHRRERQRDPHRRQAAGPARRR